MDRLAEKLNEYLRAKRLASEKRWRDLPAEERALVRRERLRDFTPISISDGLPGNWSDLIEQRRTT